MRRLYRAPSHQVQSLGKDPDVVMVVTRAFSGEACPRIRSEGGNRFGQ
jgi:hypothetical protein